MAHDNDLDTEECCDDEDRLKDYVNELVRCASSTECCDDDGDYLEDYDDDYLNVDVDEYNVETYAYRGYREESHRLAEENVNLLRENKKLKELLQEGADHIHWCREELDSQCDCYSKYAWNVGPQEWLEKLALLSIF